MPRDVDDLPGGAAFPRVGTVHTEFGMSLRDYFAAKAMQALLSAEPKTLDIGGLADAAYACADAMILARDSDV